MYFPVSAFLNLYEKGPKVGRGNFPPLNVLYEHLPMLQEGAHCVQVYHHIPIFTHILLLRLVSFWQGFLRELLHSLPVKAKAEALWVTYTFHFKRNKQCSSGTLTTQKEEPVYKIHNSLQCLSAWPV